MIKRRVLLAFGLSLVAGCAGAPPNPAELVPADVVVNTVKCEIAQLVTDYAIQRGERTVYIGQPFTVTLNLKIVDKYNAGIDVNGPLAFLALSGAVPTIGISGSIEKTWTTDTTTQFTVHGTANDRSICEKAIRSGKYLENGIGYYAFMRQISQQIGNFIAGDPKIIADKFTYETTFGVTKNISGSISYSFVPVTVKGSGGMNTNEIQGLKITVENWQKPGRRFIGDKPVGPAKPKFVPYLMMY